MRPDAGAESAKALFCEDKPHPSMPRSPDLSPRPDNGNMQNPDLIYVRTAQTHKYCTVYASIHAYRYTTTVPLSLAPPSLQLPLQAGSNKRHSQCDQ